MPLGDHDHHHPTAAAGNERRVAWALGVTVAFMVIEIAGGLIAGSLALLADAGHMLADACALTLALFAFRISRRRADPQRSYGYHRFEVLAAFANGLTLIAVAGWITVEAVLRLFDPVEVLGTPMLIVAILGLIANLVAFAILHGGERENLNMRGAMLHVAADILGSIGAIVAALIIRATGWMAADPILSVFVAVLILRGAWILVRRSAHILLEGTPDGLDLAELREALRGAVPEVRDVHHLHVWSLTGERPIVTLHASIPTDANADRVLRAIHAVLDERFGLRHATIQLETGPCPDSN
ncbi:MAG: cation transporter [Rhodospirillaceae bacterium]|jgi:cobalt-zinc-cadmium efflux system protein|nr:cation transporter [Rhodospirillaceae bacterium]MBT6118850.1 cation transporter [Rhodospirillaceae bacterium]